MKKIEFNNTKYKEIKIPTKNQLKIWIRLWKLEFWIVKRKGTKLNP